VEIASSSSYLKGNIWGPMGLALAGSIGGITLFILTVREVGTDIFLIY